MSYRSSYRSTYVPQSTYRPYRSTYSSDYTPRTSSTGTSSLYKPSTFISPPSRSLAYTSTSRTLPAIGRSTNTVSYDHGPSSRTLPLRASSTQSYETSRSNYASYTKRDDRFSVLRSGAVNTNASSSDTVSQFARTDNANRENESVNARRGSMAMSVLLLNSLVAIQKKVCRTTILSQSQTIIMPGGRHPWIEFLRR